MLVDGRAGHQQQPAADRRRPPAALQLPAMTPEMTVTDLGTMPYRDAWARQEAAHARVLAGGPPELLLVEQPPVVT
ncbi:MAG: octanoyltransferase, partial [Phycisphaerales bacterium]|nr:octanoyltransferase [Phycisphaerales bacterium]